MEKTASIQVTYTTGHRNLPYAANEEEGIYPMIWLSKEPDRIDELPELKGEPELKEFIRAINAPGLPFETFRCAHRTEVLSGRVVREMYVAVIFRNRDWAADLNGYMVLTRNIVTGLAEDSGFPDNALPFEVRLNMHWLKDEEVWAHTADIQFHFEASTEAEMRRQMSQQMSFLGKILNHR